MYPSRFTTLLLMPLAALGVSAHAAINVGPGGDYASIQPAIDFAVSHPGSNEIRVHTGVYNESLHISTAMNSGTIVLHGGYADGYLTQVQNAAANTIVSPDPGQRAADFEPSGGSLIVSDFNFYGATTTSVYLYAANSASISAARLLVTDTAVETTNAPAHAAGLYISAIGTSIVTVSDSVFERNRVSVLSGTGTASAAGAELVCSGNAECDLAGNVFRDLTIEARNAFANGGAIDLRLTDSAKSFLDANLIQQVHDGAMESGLRGRSISALVEDTAKLVARRNRVHGDTPLAVAAGVEEVEILLYQQALATLGDSLIAQSPLAALRVEATDSASARLVNLTIADNARGVYVFSTSSAAQYISNSVVTNGASDNAFQGTTFATNRMGVSAPFLAPTLFDYSLRRMDPQFIDAGTDAPAGLLGARDINGGPRVLGAHPDVGAYEADRIFADRFDP